MKKHQFISLAILLTLAAFTQSSTV